MVRYQARRGMTPQSDQRVVSSARIPLTSFVVVSQESDGSLFVSGKFTPAPVKGPSEALLSKFDPSSSPAASPVSFL